MSHAPPMFVTFLLADSQPPQPFGRRDSTVTHPPDPAWPVLIAAQQGILLPEPPEAPLAAVFPSADDALAATLALQRHQLAADRPPLRIALHSGPTAVIGSWYFGATRARTATLLAACAPGQIVLSSSCHATLQDTLPPDVTLHPLELVRLSDLLAAEPTFLLSAPDLPSTSHALRAIDSYPTNLPTQPTPFLGRDQELSAFVQRIRHDRQRLLTLIAPSGHGKTRFSLAAATHLLDDFPDGVFFVSLAPISDPALVIPTIAQTLGLKEQADTTTLMQLQTYLHHRRVLLLLDNFEQVVAAAPDIHALLEATSQLAIIVSSHVPLQLPQEQIVYVPPLMLPDLRALPPLEQLVRSAAIMLFLERLQAVQPDLLLNETQGVTIARLCTLLSGVPLAIELVAAYGDTFPLDDILTQLRGRSPTGIVTLSQVLDWSYRKLAPSTQTLFARLGVFLEGCTLEGAEAVCLLDDEEPLDVLDEIGVLLRRNLLLEEQLAGGELRYIMLDCIHDEAYRQLVKRSEEQHLRERHARYYGTMSTMLEDALQGSEQVIWLQRIQSELNNFRAALQWALTQSNRLLAEDICSGLLLFWLARGLWREGLQACEATLALDETPPSLAAARTRTATAVLVTLLRDPEQSREHYQQALALYQAIGDRVGVANILSNFGFLAQRQGDYAQAKEFYLKSIAAQEGITPTPNAAAISRLNLGGIYSQEKDFPMAERYLREAHTIACELGDQRSQIYALYNLAQLQADQGRPSEAAALLHESIQLCRAFGRHEMQDWLLFGAATIAFAHDRLLQAARLLGAAEAHLPDGSKPLATAAAERTALRDQLIARCEPAAFADAWTSGRAMTLEQALILASQETAPSMQA